MKVKSKSVTTFKKKGALRVWSLNPGTIRGVEKEEEYGRLAEIMDLVSLNEIDIFAIQETRVADGDVDPKLPAGYNWYNVGRKKTARSVGGGVAWIVDKTVRHSLLPQDKFLQTQKVEQIWIKVFLDEKNVLFLGNLYWPPGIPLGILRDDVQLLAVRRPRLPCG